MRSELLVWYDTHRRDLPWRRVSLNPYAVWVSEVMLQQTRVSVVIPYFEKWMARFPTVEALAEASLDEVFEYWQGLGYYRRARGLHNGAKIVAQEGWPQDRKGWERLPGVGSYTAGAILSIAFGVPEPAVDGNVERVYSRLFAVAKPKSELNRESKMWLASFLHGARPGDVTQALMELGATVCQPKNPDCHCCPLTDTCEARKRGLVNELPVRSARPNFINKTIYLQIPVRDGLIGWNRIPEDAWGAGLFGFPRVDALGSGPELPLVKHIITRHRITVRAALAEGANAQTWTSAQDTSGLAITALDAKVLRLLRRQNLVSLR
ncbi:MAG: A/G-specific adenine glycosylase [Fimbriimonadaceae bacterium]|nr:A/G-specific adenine glycosylase [Fimbriimonadaceae bacterium]